jgi:hypothetical protein
MPSTARIIELPEIAVEKPSVVGARPAPQEAPLPSFISLSQLERLCRENPTSYLILSTACCLPMRYTLRWATRALARRPLPINWGCA